jgi:hypothetical protein
MIEPEMTKVRQREILQRALFLAGLMRLLSPQRGLYQQIEAERAKSTEETTDRFPAASFVLVAQEWKGNPNGKIKTDLDCCRVVPSAVCSWMRRAQASLCVGARRNYVLRPVGA